ncbi:hypothetical protein [Aphanizomenon sp. UHCC 0183]|uniref:hypothetical protein n=1 Tax=Aphanizomenon sp. UHCC 0183 TaxID=2590028 RepID=UPI001C2C521E|nr:hypothetical protein [Aphanizomenon sp. UHCC 0183]
MAVACLSCDEYIRILTHVGELVEGTLEFIDRKMSESGGYRATCTERSRSKSR